MKKTQALSSLVRLPTLKDFLEASARTRRKHGGQANAARAKVKVTFQSNNQVYLWVTDRGSKN